MQIHLVRHAHALAGADDAARPLGKKGRGQIRVMADFLHRHELPAAKEFWHSPLVRSRDTAVRLVKRLRVRARLVEVAGLLPDDDPAIIAKRLKSVRYSVAIVGHEPHLSALASLLVAGRARPPLFVIRKCAVVCLERTKARWVVRWQVEPDLL